MGRSESNSYGKDDPSFTIFLRWFQMEIYVGARSKNNFKSFKLIILNQIANHTTKKNDSIHRRTFIACLIKLVNVWKHDFAYLLDQIIYPIILFQKKRDVMKIKTISRNSLSCRKKRRSGSKNLFEKKTTIERNILSLLNPTVRLFQT